MKPKITLKKKRTLIIRLGNFSKGNKFKMILQGKKTGKCNQKFEK